MDVTLWHFRNLRKRMRESRLLSHLMTILRVKLVKCQNKRVPIIQNNNNNYNYQKMIQYIPYKIQKNQ